MKLIVQPDNGAAPVIEFIRSARTSLILKQFTFTHPEILEAILESKRSGVAVRVMLNAKRSGGDRANDETFAALEKAGVSVRWSNPDFYVTHEKSMVADGSRAMVATYNLCEKYFTRTRDYGLVFENANQAAQITECFDADWNRTAWSPSADTGLVWSNKGSRLAVARFIDSAKESLLVQHPKFVDAAVLDRIVDAASRGVKVRILCGGRHGISECDILDTFASLRVMRRAGAKIHNQKKLRVHAKLLIADGKRALLGSMNLDRSAFDLRRELGVTLDQQDVVAGLIDVFHSDWEESHHYDAPDPLDPSQHHEDDFPHDPELHHE
jgi:phosphatidylserine/phosphatidylglycerophosphate/cardiolipin synthase-like enzyme